MTRKPTVGLALGSGGARGWCHVGVLRALAEIGIEPDVVAGCSMGALVGAAYVTGKLDALETWSHSLGWREVIGMVDVNLTSGGLVEGRRVVEALTRVLDGTHDFAATAKPFVVVATDMVSGREVWLKDGTVVDAVRASIALPGIFKPAHVDGRWLLDGGMTNPIPVSACRALGADVVIAVDPSADLLGVSLRAGDDAGPRWLSLQSRDLWRQFLDRLPSAVQPYLNGPSGKPDDAPPSAPGYFDVLSSAIDIMMDQIKRSRLAGEPPHVLLRPRLGHFKTLEFNRADEAVAEGRAAVQRSLAEIEEIRDLSLNRPAT